MLIPLASSYWSDHIIIIADIRSYERYGRAFLSQLSVTTIRGRVFKCRGVSFSMPPRQDIRCHMLPQRRLTTLLALTSDAAARPPRTHDTRPDLSSFLLDGGCLSEITSIRGQKRPERLGWSSVTWSKKCDGGRFFFFVFPSFRATRNANESL